MFSLSRFRLSTALCALLMATQAPAEEFRGETASGAKFVMDVPPGWFSGQPVVFYNHGYDSNPPDEPSIPENFKGYITSKGFAIVASGYSLRGWATFATMQDHKELIAVFKRQYGEPGRVYVTGASLGGLVAMQQAEQDGLGFISGVYALCAPLGGSKVWDQALDVRLSYDALCADVSGGQLPRASEQPFLLPRSAVDNNEDSETTTVEVAAAAAKCIGLGLNPALLTSGMRERKSRLLAANRIPEEFLPVNLYYATFGLSDLYFDPGKLAEGLAFENRDVNYGDTLLNASIRRVASDPLSRLRLKRNFTPSGKLSSSLARVLTTTTTGDGLVVPEHQSALLGKLDEFRWARAQVRETSGSHCGYTDAEVFAGFEAMLDWSNDLIGKPDAARLNQYCRNQNLLGVAGECRYENNPQPATLDTRIRPRSTGEPVLDARYSGLWYDPNRPGEGYVLEILSDSRALLAWYTYPPAGQVGDQRWIFAEGKVLDNGMVFDNAIMTQGGQFSRQYGAFDVTQIPFGPVSFAFDRCGHGFMEYRGPAAFGSGRHEVVQLSHIGGNSCAGTTASVPQARFSGAWAGRPFEGLFVDIQGDGRAFVTWYTYDLVRSPVWLFGEGRLEGDRIIIDNMLIPDGTQFGPAFDPSKVIYRRWGSVELDFRSCTETIVKYNALAFGYGIGQLNFNRISAPLGVSCSQ